MEIDINNNIEKSAYKVGSVVQENGFYTCAPCGNKKYFSAGTRFVSCLMCFGKERKLLRKGVEFWEKIKTVKIKGSKR